MSVTSLKTKVSASKVKEVSMMYLAGFMIIVRFNDCSYTKYADGEKVIKPLVLSNVLPIKLFGHQSLTVHDFPRLYSILKF